MKTKEKLDAKCNKQHKQHTRQREQQQRARGIHKKVFVFPPRHRTLFMTSFTHVSDKLCQRQHTERRSLHGRKFFSFLFIAFAVLERVSG
jgi:hypothetical protein